MATIGNHRPDNKYRPYNANEFGLVDLNALELGALTTPVTRSNNC